jgi:mannose-6-phosphate isomerase-like protein (cupin superfamily)
MRASCLAFSFLAAISAASGALAQTADAPPAMQTFASSGDVTALIAKAKAERKEGQANVIEPILQLAPYRANLEYRTLPAPAAVHEKEAELMYVIDGSGTIVTGGTLANSKRTNPTNLSGTAIDGGASRTVHKGDFIFVPENTPHQFNAVDGTLVLMTLHVPRPAS